MPQGQACAADGIVSAADAIGYPVVLKALSEGLAHKSEVGAVQAGILSEDDLRQAADRMADRYQRFLVEQMVVPAVAELIVGVSRDPTFGLSLLIGTGGTLVELLDDTVSLLLPVQREEARAAISSIRAGTLLNGYRGSAAGNIEAVLDAIEAIAAFAMKNADRLHELDVNPLLVTPDAAVVVDALIRIGGNAD